MSAPAAAPILVTRPDKPGRDLAAALAARGAPALWLPAFDLAPAPDPAAARAALDALQDDDLAVFVSPAAVRAVAGLLGRAWPARTAIGAVGNATAQAVREELALPDTVRIVAPDADDDGGSESLLVALDAQAVKPRRALILRAAAGREWLSERLAERGTQVQAVAVYDRRPHVLSDSERAQLAAGSGVIESVFSSSEAVETLRTMLAGVNGAWHRLLAGTAIASHPRVAERLVAAGFAHVVVARLAADDVLDALARARGADGA